jgi:hypothetical protein
MMGSKNWNLMNFIDINQERIVKKIVELILLNCKI